MTRHLTYANVMVTILAFLVLGGGTALAAYVVSSNSQIGPNTVSGHAGAAANKNIIAASVNGQDVADNSLGGADILEPSLAGNARKLIYNASPSQQTKTLTTAAPYTIKGRCFTQGIQLVVRLIVHGPAGAA